MPLPSALQARLLKRGILHQDSKKRDDREEVFAEDYDGEGADETTRIVVFQVANCVNRANAFHECTDYCKNKHGVQEFKPPSERHQRKRRKLLQNCPLPEHWREVADPETGRYYYWNMNTDEVAWLPPTHPRSRPSFSKDVLIKMGKLDPAKANWRRCLKFKGIEIDDRRPGTDSPPSSVPQIPLPDAPSSAPPASSRAVPNQRRFDLQSRKRRQQAGAAQKDDLDPMDPASYADVPRGGWRSGMDDEPDKTGVDVTAAGPLFQARPYPNPGQILNSWGTGETDKDTLMLDYTSNSYRETTNRAVMNKQKYEAEEAASKGPQAGPQAPTS